MSRVALLLSLGSSVFGSGNAGCGSACDTKASATNTVVYTNGHTDATLTHYESNSFSEPFLAFPPGRRYEFPHGLGKVPTHLGIFLSFQEKDSSFSLASGNEALIEQVDANVIRVRNDTCADFFVRVDASAAPVSVMP